MQNQNEPDSSESEFVKETHTAATTSNIDYSKTKHGRFYANHVGVNVTMFDIRLLLSDVDVDSPNNKLVASETLTLFLSPELAYMIHTALGAAILSYTQRFGKLRLPEELIVSPDISAVLSSQAHEGSSPPPAASPEPQA